MKFNGNNTFGIDYDNGLLIKDLVESTYPNIDPAFNKFFIKDGIPYIMNKKGISFSMADLIPKIEALAISRYLGVVPSIAVKWSSNYSEDVFNKLNPEIWLFVKKRKKINVHIKYNDDELNSSVIDNSSYGIFNKVKNMHSKSTYVHPVHLDGSKHEGEGKYTGIPKFFKPTEFKMISKNKYVDLRINMNDWFKNLNGTINYDGFNSSYNTNETVADNVISILMNSFYDSTNSKPDLFKPIGIKSNIVKFKFAIVVNNPFSKTNYDKYIIGPLSNSVKIYSTYVSNYIGLNKNNEDIYYIGACLQAK